MVRRMNHPSLGRPADRLGLRKGMRWAMRASVFLRALSVKPSLLVLAPPPVANQLDVSSIACLLHNPPENGIRITLGSLRSGVNFP